MSARKRGGCQKKRASGGRRRRERALGRARGETLHITADIDKDAKDYVVILTPTARELLERTVREDDAKIKNADGLIFGAQEHDTVVKAAAREVLGEQRGRKVSPYDFRHATGRETMKATGGDLGAVQAALKHTSSKTTTQYLAPDEERGQAALLAASETRLTLAAEPVVRLQQAKPYVPSAANASGALAAEIFTRLDRGERVNKIVKELRVHPDVVLGIGSTWARVEKGLFLRSRHIIALANALRVRPTRDADELMDRLAHAVGELQRACCMCESRRPVYCFKCTRTRVEQARQARRATCSKAAPFNAVADPVTVDVKDSPSRTTEVELG
jgi:hypothetical protein